MVWRFIPCLCYSTDIGQNRGAEFVPSFDAPTTLTRPHILGIRAQCPDFPTEIDKSLGITWKITMHESRVEGFTRGFDALYVVRKIHYPNEPASFPLRRAYRGLSQCVYPNARRIQGKSLLQLVAAATHPDASDIPGLREVICHGYGLDVSERDYLLWTVG